MSTYRLWRVSGHRARSSHGGLGSAVAAQLPTYGVGRPPTAEEVRAWNLTIRPDGQGLPPGSGTAALGKPVYAERCAACHGETGEDPKYSLLVGGRGTLADRQADPGRSGAFGNTPPRSGATSAERSRSTTPAPSRPTRCMR